MSLTRTMRSIVRGFVLIVALACVCGVVSRDALGQNETVHDRKLKVNVVPRYPDIARKMGLSGLVKLQVVIGADGSVKETKVIGGHPILVNAALDAVKKWKFEPARAESTGELEIKFQPD